jgi:alkylation response protein AidB-like acyl-CoA dehydrogenase
MTLQIFGTARDNLPWTEEKYEEFSRAAVAGGLFNSCATEPELGSPSRGAFFKTRAERTDDRFVINGHKSCTSGGRFLTHLLIGLTLEDENAVILVEGDREGVEWIENWGDGLSLRASNSFDMLLKDVHVPAENLVKNAERGEKKKPAWFPMMLGSTYLGIAMASRDALIKYALERVPTALGKPISTLPKIQREIGEIDMKLQAAKSLLLEVAGSGPKIAGVAAAKHFAVTVANEVTDQALRVAGGTSLTRALPLERYFRDVRAGTMQPPSGDTALEAVGRDAIESMDSKND